MTASSLDENSSADSFPGTLELQSQASLLAAHCRSTVTRSSGCRNTPWSFGEWMRHIAVRVLPNSPKLTHASPVSGEGCKSPPCHNAQVLRGGLGNAQTPMLYGTCHLLQMGAMTDPWSGSTIHQLLCHLASTQVHVPTSAPTA